MTKAGDCSPATYLFTCKHPDSQGSSEPVALAGVWPSVASSNLQMIALCGLRAHIPLMLLMIFQEIKKISFLILRNIYKCIF